MTERVRVGRDLQEWRRQDEARQVLDALPSIQRAAFWHDMYRHHLYRQTTLHDRLRQKLNKAQDDAFADVDRIMRQFGLDRLHFFGMKHGAGLANHVPFWKDVPNEHEARGYRLQRRMFYWQGRGDQERADHYQLLRDSVVYLNERSWPLTDAALNRARRWRAAETDRVAQQMIEAQAAQARREEIEAQEKRRIAAAIWTEANKMLGELMPGLRIARRAQKAQAYDVLVKLLEQADVDERTKEAIGRLRAVVEEERGTPRNVPAALARTAAGRDRGGHPADRGGGVSAAA